MKTVAMILAGGAGTRLDILSKHRAKPAVPFGGKYRVIDFVLSNCVNSGIYSVAVLTQYLPRSMNEHIGIGRSWDLDRKIGGVEMLAPYQGKEGDWYSGTADAIFKNMSFFTDKKADSVLILSGDHIYKMNYQDMIRQHELTGADMTIGVNPVEIELASEFGILSADDAGKITEFEEKPKQPKSNLASMGIYVFKADFLKKILLEFCGNQGVNDFGKDLIPSLIKTNSIYAYKFQGYWRDVGTLEEYWKANMELLENNPPVNLYEDDLPIYTKHPEVPPALFGDNAAVLRSLVSGGCMIYGKVEHSVLCSEVVVEEGAIVKDSIILNKTVIKKGTLIERAIIDKEVVIGERCIIGTGEDYTVSKEKPKNVYTGLNLIGKFAHIPDNTVIERNCRIMSRVNAADFDGNIVKSGETVHSKSEEDKSFQYRQK